MELFYNHVVISICRCLPHIYRQHIQIYAKPIIHRCNNFLITELENGIPEYIYTEKCIFLIYLGNNFVFDNLSESINLMKGALAANSLAY